MGVLLATNGQFWGRRTGRTLRARTVQNGGEEVRESVVVCVVPQGWLGLEPLQPPFFLALSLHYRPILCLPVLGVPVVPWCGDRD